MVAVRTDGVRSAGAHPSASAAPGSGRGPATESAVEAAPRARSSRRARPESSSGASQPPLTHEQQVTLAIVLGGALDPMTAMMAMQTQMRDVRTRAGEAASEGAARTSEGQEAERMESLEKAERHVAKMLKQRIPGWAKKLIAWVITAVAVVAAAFTGGASLVLVAAAVVLLAAAEVVEALAKAGHISGKAGMVTSLVLKIAAAVLMMVSGNVSGVGNLAGAAAQAVPLGVQIAQVAAACASTMASAHESRVQMTNAVHQGRADMDHADAEQSGLDSEGSLERMELAVEQMKRIRMQFLRITKRLQAAQQARDEGLSIAARALA